MEKGLFPEMAFKWDLLFKIERCYPRKDAYKKIFKNQKE